MLMLLGLKEKEGKKGGEVAGSYSRAFAHIHMLDYVFKAAIGVMGSCS
jgi:hypothetical protein